jgi:uncharacterized membrane protein YgcG
MEPLDPVAAESHFTPIERTEDALGSVTIRVFECPGCGAFDKTARRRPFSSYSACPSCDAVALEKRTWTLAQATYATDGAVRTEYTCRHCSYQEVSDRLLPRRVRQAASDGYLLGSSSSSSGASSSSHSDHSDSGFGGGGSSGDGASGSW